MKKIISKSLFCVMLLMLISVAVSLATFVSFAETYFTVRVEYRFVDDSVAHDPYVAVLAEGEDVHITVNNPALPGYKPQRSKELSTTIPAEKTTQLDYENLQANHEIIIAGFGGQGYLDSSDERLRKLRKAIDEKGADTIISVDGGITKENIGHVYDCGARLFVAGSSVFRAEDPAKAIDELIRCGTSS